MTSSSAKQKLPHTLKHVRFTYQQRHSCSADFVTCVETETLAPLKSEIGDGRRRLLFTDAVAAAMWLFFCSCIKRSRRKQEREGLMAVYGFV
jgi:hypothetical protein